MPVSFGYPRWHDLYPGEVEADATDVWVPLVLSREETADRGMSDHVAIGRLRARLPETLLITDDMQMQGLQKALGTRAASLQSLRAGIDMLCIGNNLFDQEAEMAGIAEAVEWALREERLDADAIGRSIARVQARKVLLA